MNNVIASIYNKLLAKGRLTKEQIPKDAIIVKETPKEEAPVEILGAITLPKISGITFDETLMAKILSTDIFNEPILNGMPFPLNIEYKLIRIERNPIFMIDNVMVNFIQSADGISFSIPRDIDRMGITGAPIFRIDIEIHSSNYETMYLTIYVN